MYRWRKKCLRLLFSATIPSFTKMTGIKLLDTASSLRKSCNRSMLQSSSAKSPISCLRLCQVLTKTFSRTLHPSRWLTRSREAHASNHCWESLTKTAWTLQAMASQVPNPSRSTTIRRRLGKQTKPRYIKQCWPKWRLNKKDSYQVRVTTWLNWPTKNMCLRMKRLMQSVSSSPSSKSSSETKTIRYKSTRSLTTKRSKLLLSRPQIWRKQACRS